MKPNQLGCYSEYLFCTECIKRGYEVSMPLLQTSIYDCIVDTGKGVFKIQIKASEKVPTDRENSVNIPLVNSKSIYTVEKVDYFAVFSSFYNGFFIFPNKGEMKSFRASLKGKNKMYFNRFSFV